MKNLIHQGWKQKKTHGGKPVKSHRVFACPAIGPMIVQAQRAGCQTPSAILTWILDYDQHLQDEDLWFYTEHRIAKYLKYYVKGSIND